MIKIPILRKKACFVKPFDQQKSHKIIFHSSKIIANFVCIQIEKTFVKFFSGDNKIEKKRKQMLFKRHYFRLV